MPGGGEMAGGSGPALGLVCITSDREIRYRTITRTRLFTLSRETQIETLESIYRDNISTLGRAIDYCVARKIGMYRIPSGLFPSSEDNPGRDVLESLAPLLEAVGTQAIAAGIRLVMHPDQFVVLSSLSDAVVANSIAILEHHARVLSMLGQPATPWTALQIHGGKSGRSVALLQTIVRLPEAIRSRLVLENDEYAYSASEILVLCRAASIPMVFDAHHHVVHEGLQSYDDASVHEMTLAAGETWPDPDWQIVHISNGKERFDDPRHADYVATIPGAFRSVPWMEVEAKAKELAIRRVQQEWL